MKTIVIYKSKYGATKTYAQWIADALGCEAVDAKGVKCEDLLPYDTIVYGGGLYAEVIAGVSLITKNLEALKDKKLIVFTVGVTPIDCRDYYDKLVIDKNFKPEMLERVKVFNFMGRMILDELSLVHRTAIKSLKKIMQGKENPTDMEKLLIKLCEQDVDGCDKESITDLVLYAK